MAPGRDDPRNDAELAEAFNRGDVGAFEALYARHKGTVWRLALRLCRDEHDAADVFQETFAYLLRRAPRLRLTARFTTFIYPHLRGLAVEVRRRRCPEELAEPQLVAAPSRAEDTGLEEVLRGLGAGHREVVLLRYVDGLTGEEIAAVLGIPLGTVKSRLHAAIAALRSDPRTRDYFEIE